MERIAEKLSEIEKTARAIVDNAQEQKHQMEMQMQKKREHLSRYGKGDERKDIKDSVGSCNKHGKTSKETRRTE